MQTKKKENPVVEDKNKFKIRLKMDDKLLEQIKAFFNSFFNTIETINYHSKPIRNFIPIMGIILFGWFIWTGLGPAMDSISKAIIPQNITNVGDIFVGPASSWIVVLAVGMLILFLVKNILGGPRYY